MPAITESIAEKGLIAHIVLEGNICAGKSTMCSHMQSAMGKKLNIQSEMTDEAFLKAFYGDMPRWGFAFQMFMLTTRLHQVDEGKRLSTKGELVVTDRGILGDWCFARKNWLDGNIDDEQYEIYMDVVSRRALNTLTEKVDVTLYLDVEPEQCCWRMRNLRKTEAEENVLLEYLTGIDDMYFEGMVNMLSMKNGKAGKVLVVKWTKFGDDGAVTRNLMDVCEGRRGSPSVKFLKEEEACSLNHAHNFEQVYDTEEDVDAGYEMMNSVSSPTASPVKMSNRASTAGSTSPASCLDYFDEQISETPNEPLPVLIRYNQCFAGEKSAKPGSMQPRSNAFKRLVMHHLSLGREVCFYAPPEFLC